MMQGLYVVPIHGGSRWGSEHTQHVDGADVHLRLHLSRLPVVSVRKGRGEALHDIPRDWEMGAHHGES